MTNIVTIIWDGLGKSYFLNFIFKIIVRLNVVDLHRYMVPSLRTFDEFRTLNDQMDQEEKEGNKRLI